MEFSVLPSLTTFQKHPEVFEQSDIFDIAFQLGSIRRSLPWRLVNFASPSTLENLPTRRRPIDLMFVSLSHLSAAISRRSTLELYTGPVSRIKEHCKGVKAPLLPDFPLVIDGSCLSWEGVNNHHNISKVALRQQMTRSKRSQDK